MWDSYGYKLFTENEQEKEERCQNWEKTKTQQKSPWYTQEMGRKTTDNFPVVTEENQNNTCLGKRGLMKNMYIYIHR